VFGAECAESVGGWTPAIFSLVYSLVGIALSIWSFNFGEAGAAPDRYASDNIDLAQETLNRGSRFRSRWSANVLFKCGALMLMASVLMNFADGRRLGLISASAVLSYCLTVFTVYYLARTTRGLWLDRRENAFDAFYGRDVFPYHKDRDAVRVLFFRRNPMPYFSVFQRSFEYDDLTTEELSITLPHQPPSSG
jgi:hypothetical protein